MMKSAKIFLLLILAFGFFFVFIQKTLAYTPNTNYLQFENALKSPDMNLESFVANTVNSLMNTGVNQSFGCISCKEGKPLFANASPSDFGAVGVMAYLIGVPYTNKPASSVDYIADIGNRLNLTEEVQAQDNTVGYKELNPSLPIWKAFRNISYSLMAIVLVFIAFMVMFRLKISPQAVVTLQSAIPSIVISLVLITFSYAIVGLLLDITWIVNNLLLRIFASLFYDLGGIGGLFQGGHALLTLGGNVTDAWSLFMKMFAITLLPFLLGFITILALSIAPVVGAGFLIPGAGWGVAGVIVVIILLLFAVICLLALIKTFFTLIKVYINIILSLIFSPFILLFGAIPGRGNIISGWFSSLIANLITLPVILAMVLTGSYLVCASWSQHWGILFSGGTFVMNALSAIFSGFGGLDPAQQAQIFLSVFAGIGIILMTPKAADIIQAFFAGKPFAYGTAIGEAVGPMTLAGRMGGAEGIEKGWGRFKPGGEGVTIRGHKFGPIPQEIAGIKVEGLGDKAVSSTAENIRKGKL